MGIGTSRALAIFSILDNVGLRLPDSIIDKYGDETSTSLDNSFNDKHFADLQTLIA